ncbi:hypothetical protein QTO12_05945 [Vibrio owensii]|uniref:hypothetical protein n=1 Tax=Vibrio owensii TaxID=696485 RepID=UPI002F3F690C
MNVSILIASLCLVLVGLLFGFNIQVNKTAVDALSAISSFVAAVSAAAAAYFSYSSIGQWKKQTKHSLLYEHLTTLEDLLVPFLDEYKEKVFDANVNKPLDVLSIVPSCARGIKRDYSKAYNKVRELIDEGKREELRKIELDTLIAELGMLTVELKTHEYNVEKYFKEHPETQEKSFGELKGELPELQYHMNKSCENIFKVNNACNEAIIVLSKLRASL